MPLTYVLIRISKPYPLRAMARAHVTIKIQRAMSGRGTNLGPLTHCRNNSAQSWGSRCSDARARGIRSRVRVGKSLRIVPRPVWNEQPDAALKPGYQTRQDFSGYMGLPFAH
jgi:hypothetical protein